ncbi:hypothetical protein ACFSSC_07810 [Corynebacterium mendelii]|uniref:Serine protease n=1 Tax=Corynebacterium mendelii TaxID=2765362 RepID=A0A939E310_9CORY|nr:hypothetical protein [Corynebacterium mendelii]MBN9644761.1 hypothetical protein [Corynebacterium mendelii]
MKNTAVVLAGVLAGLLVVALITASVADSLVVSSARHRCCGDGPGRPGAPGYPAPAAPPVDSPVPTSAPPAPNDPAVTGHTLPKDVGTGRHERSWSSSRASVEALDPQSRPDHLDEMLLSYYRKLDESERKARELTGGFADTEQWLGTYTWSTVTPRAAPARPTGRPGHRKRRPSSRIFRQSKGYGYLDAATVVQPGAKIRTTHGYCSAGWFAHDNRGRDYMIIAGHCGSIGDRVYLPATGDFIGTIVTDDDDTNDDREYMSGLGLDLALVELAGNRFSAGLDLGPAHFPQISHWLTMSEVEKLDDAAVCHLGYRSGLSCGRFLSLSGDNVIHFESIVDHGDSGGPVFVVYRRADGGTNTAAVGVARGNPAHDALDVSSSSIEPYMTGYGLTLYSPSAG